jgi:hypothetical protein
MECVGSVLMLCGPLSLAAHDFSPFSWLWLASENEQFGKNNIVIAEARTMKC